MKKIILLLTIFLVLGMAMPGINADDEDDSTDRTDSDNSGSDDTNDSDEEEKDEDDTDENKSEDDSDNDYEDNSRLRERQRIRTELADGTTLERIELRKRTELENRKRLRRLVAERTGKEISIEVDLKENEAEIRIKINGDEEEFSIEQTDRGSIIKAIQEKTGLTPDQIVRIIHVERERDDEIEIRIVNGEARIKIEIGDREEEFKLPTKNKEEILKLIAERLGTTPDKISDIAEIEFRERKKFRTKKGLEEIEIEEETDKGKIRRKIKIKNHIAETELELEEKLENGENRLKVKLSNGNFRDIKIMPDRASEIAIERLKAQNIKIELKETGNRAVFEARTERQGRFLGIFKARLSERLDIDSETGEVSNRGKPFWAFLILNQQPIEETEEITDQI